MALSEGEMGIRGQVEEWKEKYYDIEKVYAEIQCEFDKEKALWEDKFAFHKK